MSPLVFYLIFGMILANAKLVKQSDFLTSFAEVCITVVFFALGLEENVAHFKDGIRKAPSVRMRSGPGASALARVCIGHRASERASACICLCMSMFMFMCMNMCRCIWKQNKICVGMSVAILAADVRAPHSVHNAPNGPVVIRCGDIVVHVNDGDSLAAVVKALPSQISETRPVSVSHLVEASVLGMDPYTASAPGGAAPRRAPSGRSCTASARRCLLRV